ncbi:MAG: endonuclease III [Acidobacteriota bacterium]|nr:MAG: endonuclease III [Acidobacteriota bacterium]
MSRPEDPRKRAKLNAGRILKRLERLYPEADCELSHGDAFQLLVATILSAQTTDKAVNKVTPALFRRYPTPQRLAAADPQDVEAMISKIGLYRNKTKSIIGAAQAIVERFGGQVPEHRRDLESLPGVGRKTANVVLSTAFREPALAVDTHVQRLARLLGLSVERDPLKIEHDLTSVFSRQRWSFVSHALIWHGRRVCQARAPRCADCGLNDVCPSAGHAQKQLLNAARKRADSVARRGTAVRRKVGP